VRTGRNGQGEDKLVRFGSSRMVEKFGDAQKFYALLGSTGPAARRHQRDNSLCVATGIFDGSGILENLDSCYLWS